MLMFLEISDSLWRTWAYVTQPRLLAVAFGIGFALLAITLFIASRTRWGQAKPLTKCIVLSVLAHVWLLMYALGSRNVLPQGDPQGRQQNMSVSFEDTTSVLTADFADADDSHNAETSQLSDGPETAASSTKPWEQAVDLASLPKPVSLEQLLNAQDMTPPPLLEPPSPQILPTPMPALPPLDSVADTSEPQPMPAALPNQEEAVASSLPSVLGPTTRVESVLPPASSAATSLSESPAVAQQQPEYRMESVSANHSPVLPPEMQLPADTSVPREYQLRQAPDRLRFAAAYGADADSEAAVRAGLEWLAQSQSPDGSWDAKKFGGGTETNALGETRYGTGSKADTGVSGLALLAFLSAGHTHMSGEYRATVQHGLEYLIRVQMPSGDLSGPKQVGSDRGVLNARMYCHSIATLALAEAHVMTDDVILRDSLLRAAQYSINAQDIRGGGWRYRPHDPGDLSQFGWQAMALKSVERSGIEIPIEVSRRMRRFLDSCAAGPSGGLATYRPGEGRPSETMTAEALACRLLLGYPTGLAAQQEATTMIMRNRPGVGEDNVYFWYYATLALFQLQDENWRVWNQAMKQHLLQTQTPSYREQAGSWEPDGMWGGYGGRVYSTAMSCLCLEVYYRYLPMYQRANLAQGIELQRTSR